MVKESPIFCSPMVMGPPKMDSPPQNPKTPKPQNPADGNPVLKNVFDRCKFLLSVTVWRCFAASTAATAFLITRVGEAELGMLDHDSSLTTGAVVYDGAVKPFAL